jgi:hypothetical protein
MNQQMSGFAAVLIVLKKGVRKATGQDNAWDDAKDEAHDAVENLKDEASYHKKKIEKE